MKRILPVIVVSQFFCTSLWFAGNAILSDLVKDGSHSATFLVSLTSAVQFGFISGTLLFAILAIADRWSPSRVFFLSAMVAAVCNLALAIGSFSSELMLACRFLTGFFLAGVYPVGMKIASDHYREGLGKSLGFLVGALVLGTAFPHLLRSIAAGLPWKYVVYVTSLLSVAGGLAIFLLVPDGPFRKPGAPLQPTAFISGFRKSSFRSAAFGYFGHMWELYTFWAFVPVLLKTNSNHWNRNDLNIPLLSFLIIVSGAIACALGGLLSGKWGARRIAVVCLLISCTCCLLSPLFIYANPFLLFIFLLLWGMTVVADSPMFSTLVAQHAPLEGRGSALTIVTSIGFAITIVSIQFIGAISSSIDPQFLYMLLAIGPVLGLLALYLSAYKN